MTLTPLHAGPPPRSWWKQIWHVLGENGVIGLMAICAFVLSVVQWALPI
jgi:hypothetical protein